MAYLDRTPPNNRAVVLVGVALLHVAAGYAIVNGLAVKYIDDITTILEARNIPIEPPPPSPQPTAQPQQDRRTFVPRPSLDLPTQNQRVVEPTRDILPPLPVPAGEVKIVPIPQPQPLPTGTPREAKPMGRSGNWVTTDDYPARDLREGNQGVTRFLLAIGTDGRVQSCQIIGSSGFPGLDRTTCEKVRTRARFESATDGSGNRIAGTFSGSIRWVIPE
jgi:protein TonB